jgi:hypothetical protein
VLSSSHLDQGSISTCATMIVVASRGLPPLRSAPTTPPKNNHPPVQVQKVRRVSRELQHEHMRQARIKIKSVRCETRGGSSSPTATYAFAPACFPANGRKNPARCPFDPCKCAPLTPCWPVTPFGTACCERYTPISPCACACVGGYDDARAAAGTSCQWVVPPDGLQLRE